jgi:hypothetical protein
MPWTHDLKRAGPDILRAFSLMFHDPESAELQALLQKMKLTNKKWKSGSHVHSILKYTTRSLNHDERQTLGLLRSVVLDQYGKILAYSPPKCVVPSATEFNGNNNSNNNNNNILVEELVEGTMINVFYHKPNGQEEGADWDLATKSCVGGNIVFHSLANQPNNEATNEATNEANNEANNEATQPPKKTFRRMFLECMNEAGLEFDALQKDCCYSFVMQHPNNHIVRQIRAPTLYLIAAYKIDNENLVVEEQCREEQLARINTHANEKTLVRLPLQFTDVDLHVLRDIYASANAPYDFPGLVCRERSTDERSTGVRFKFRNPNYECIKNMPGSDAKLLFQNLSLRQQGKDKVNEHLDLHPEHSEAFEKVQTDMHAYTTQLFESYIGYYVKRDRPFPAEFKMHMFHLHRLHKENNERITLERTIAYVNGLTLSQQMYALTKNTFKTEKA